MAAQFLTLRSCGQNGVWRLLEQSKAAAPTLALQGRHCRCLYADMSADSLETRLSFTATAEEQGARCSAIQPQEWRQDVESLALQAPLYAQGADALLVQGLPTNALEVLAAASSLPVCSMGNASSNPALALADLALIQQSHADLSQVRIAWMGGVNGLTCSLIEAAMFVPFEFFIALPQWSVLDHDLLDLALRAGARIFLSHEPSMVLEGAQVVYAGLAPSAAQGAPLTGGMRLSPEALALASPNAALFTAESLSPACYATESIIDAAAPLWEQRLAMRRHMQALILRDLFV
jgi:ornithine carbamoyltransferase